MATVSPDWVYTLSLPHDPRAPRIARTTVRSVLGCHGLSGLADTAELLTSELVTNAYRHTDGPSSLRLRGTGGRLRVSVWDTEPAIPSPFDRPPCPVTRALPAQPDADSDGGRGLQIVRHCADSWGAYRLGEDLFGASGKLLWFELGPAGSPQHAFAVAA